MVNWEQTLRQKWATLDFSDMKIQTNAVQHIFEAEVQFNDLNPKAVRVELDADGINDSDPIRLEMKHVRQLAGASGGYIYSAVVSAARPSTDYTARLIPYRDGAAVPLGDAHMLWQR